MKLMRMPTAGRLAITRAEQDEGSIFLNKQIFAAMSSSFLALNAGITFAFSGVLLPQLKNDQDFKYDVEMGSWIASMVPLAMALGSLIAGYVSDRLGRRITHIAMACPFIVGWLLIAYGKTLTVMLLGRFITGFTAGAVRPVNIIYLGEISAPKYRGIIMFFAAIAVNIGVLLSHIIGTFVFWRTAALIFAIISALEIILMPFMKESPLWLISTGNTKGGSELFRWFRGQSEAAEKELNAMLNRQKDRGSNMSLKQTFQSVFKATFLKPFVTVLVLFILLQFCGVNNIMFYNNDMIESIFGGEIDTFVTMMGIDVIAVMSTVIIALSSNCLPRRLTFFVSSFGSAIALIFLTIYLFVGIDGYLWIPVITISLFIWFASVLSSLCWSFSGELFPAQVRGLGSGVSSASSCILLFVSIKTTPYVMTNYTDGVLYASFAAITVASAIYLCFFLPNTDGITLQDIEESYELKKPLPSNNSTTEITVEFYLPPTSSHVMRPRLSSGSLMEGSLVT